jgi:hypothetical protein
MQNKPVLSILVIATKNYSTFLPNLLSSIDYFVCRNKRIEVIVLTDNPTLIKNLSTLFPRLDLKVIEIESLGWPEATLYRFDLIIQNFNVIQGKFFMYLDADTEISSEISAELIVELLKVDDIALVSHPGYFNRSFIHRFIYKTFLGPWETNQKSCANVKFVNRKQYVCGGVWFGKLSAIFNMVVDLRESVLHDLKNGIVSKWHDESHLNKWFVNHRAKVLSPAWAYANEYSALKSIVPIITVIDKGKEWEKIGK